ncbi:iron chelate uptake ABC transporter family permease subunit [Metabacillus indicus]|uniref:iron chelate uptake ABC transporter family permease subunit n=1 Tax=Metabacillus indicus TaxID=246786 RepID=UPI003CE94536
MNKKTKLMILAGAAVLFAGVFLFYDVGRNPDYVLPKRGIKIAAIVLTGGCIAFSTMIFQTITANRILTPSIIGLDSLYLFIQTFIIFVFGSQSLTMTDKNINFLLSVGLMVLFALLLYQLLFKREGRNIYFLLLVGIVFGTLFGSMSSFMQVLIDPNEFQIVQDRMFASFNNVNSDLLLVSAVITGAAAIYFVKFSHILDVLSLGKEHAVNLGIDYDGAVKRLLILVAVLVSAATALVGPITFLGLLVANVAQEMFKTHQHKYLIPGAILVSIIALLGGQFIVERIFTFSTTLSVIINFIGGVYFIYLLLRENKSW